MPKQCSIEGCHQNVFTHSFCKRHSYLYYNSKPKKDKPIVKPAFVSDELILAKIKKEKSQHIGIRCQFSGIHGGNVQLVHIIRRSDNKGYKCDERNLILGRQEYHQMFDDGKANELMVLFPWRMKAILKRMKALDEFYFNRYCGHNNINTEDI